MTTMIIGFDYDGVIDGNESFANFIAVMSPMLNQNITFILTTRDIVNDEMKERVQSLGLQTNRITAIGKQMTNHMFDSKAHYMQTLRVPCDLFFDNDPYEIDALRKAGIPCIWVPEMDKDSLMWEITEGFFGERQNEII